MNEYKKILLLKGLKHIDDFHFSMIKSLLAPDLKLTTKTQQKYDRIKIADLMEVKFQGAACVDKLVELLQDIEIYKDLAKTLKNETLKGNREEPLSPVCAPSSVLSRTWTWSRSTHLSPLRIQLP